MNNLSGGICQATDGQHDPHTEVIFWMCARAAAIRSSAWMRRRNAKPIATSCASSDRGLDILGMTRGESGAEGPRMARRFSIARRRALRDPAGRMAEVPSYLQLAGVRHFASRARQAFGRRGSRGRVVRTRRDARLLLMAEVPAREHLPRAVNLPS